MALGRLVQTLCSLPYAAVTSARNALYDLNALPSYRSSLPVISVGNVTVGGSGKSPFVWFLVKELVLLGYRPVVLSRGYGGKEIGPLKVAAGMSAEQVGDEPLMHFAELGGDIPVVVSRKRVLGAKLIEAEKLGDVIVLDDGFQHRALRRDIDIVLLDVSSEREVSVLNGALLPFGRLREFVSPALRRADCAVWLRRSDQDIGSLASVNFSKVLSGKPQFRLRLKPSHFIDLFTGRHVELVELGGRVAGAMTAVAKPEYFIEMLERLGVRVNASRAFRDHHLFTAEEFAKFAATNSPIIVTGKDAVKLSGFVQDPGRVYVLLLEAELEGQGEAQKFSDFLNSRLAHGLLTPRQLTTFGR